MPHMTRSRAEALLADARAQLEAARDLKGSTDRAVKAAGAAWEESQLKRVDALIYLARDINRAAERQRQHPSAPGGQHPSPVRSDP